MQVVLTKIWGKTCLILFFVLLGLQLAVAQDAQTQKEIIVAIDSAKNGKYEQAIPVLKKYADAKGFGDLSTLQINVYLNFCYLATKQKEALDVDKVNRLTESYLGKNEVIKSDTAKIFDEIGSLFYAGIINGGIGNYGKLIEYISIVKGICEKKNLGKSDALYSETLRLLCRGYFYLKDYKTAIDIGEQAWILNNSLKGSINSTSVELLEILYLSYQELNEPEKSLESLLKEVKIGKDFWGSLNPVYINKLKELAIIYSNFGAYEKSIEIYLQASDLAKKALGIEDPVYLLIMNNLAQNYYSLYKFQESLEIYNQIMPHAKEVLGEHNSLYLTIINNLAILYSSLGKNLEAQSLLELNVKILKELKGDSDADYFLGLSNLVQNYYYTGNLDKSEEIYANLLLKVKSTFGEHSQIYLRIISGYANSEYNIGHYKNAKNSYEEVVQIAKELFGENHPNYLLCKNYLALSLTALGDYQSSNSIYNELTNTASRIFGTRNPSYLKIINDYAYNLTSMGDHLTAKKLYCEILPVMKEVLGENHPYYLTSLSNLADVYSNLDEYSKAIEINNQIVSVREKELGDHHPDYFLSINNLLQTYIKLGDFEKAKIIYERNLPLMEKILGDRHPIYLTSLGNLAMAYSGLGEYKRGLEINQKVVKLRDEILGDKHPDYLLSLSNLSRSYIEIEDYEKAKELYERYIPVVKESIGDTHEYYLYSLGNLGTVYACLEDYQKAKSIFKLVRLTSQKAFGNTSDLYIQCLSNLAATEILLNQSDSSLIYMRESLTIRKKSVIDYFLDFTEHQREMFWNQYSSDFKWLPVFIEKNRSADLEAIGDSYDIILFTKGLLLNTSIDFNQQIAEKGSSEAKAKFEELKLLRLQIQRLQEKPIAERYLNVDSLETVVQQKETELIKISKEYGDFTRNLKINWKDVQANLQDKDVAIEFVEYPTLTDTIKYAALVLRKGWQYPRMISLFRKDQIDEFIKQDKDKIYSNGYVGKQTRKLVWEPLEKVVSPGERVYFSPAGIYHQLAIENLAASDSTTLGDTYQMYRLSSTKELAIQTSKSKYKSAVLYGGLQYDLDSAKMVAESKKYLRDENQLAFRGYSNDTTVRKGWEYLGGTLQEVEQINRLMNSKQYLVTEYTRETGNEESFKSLSGKSPEIIHIATHGFFQPVEESRKNPFIQMRMGDQQESGGWVDPMLRSGLMLSGGNKAWQGGKIPENIEDGVLTAREISRMDLRGTDLVVLSACETGLGEVSSEGVFGLQRSFKQAGVKNLIMSLWEVNDQATSFMMEEFYTNLLSGEDLRKAFTDAKQKCKQKFSEPQYWAAFVLLN